MWSKKNYFHNYADCEGALGSDQYEDDHERELLLNLNYKVIMIWATYHRWAGNCPQIDQKQNCYSYGHFAPSIFWYALYIMFRTK